MIAEGEVDQLTAQRQVETSEEHYLHIINAKTAALFAAACRIAPVVAEAGEEAEEALEAYGRYLGIAFQLVDDAIDYSSDEATMPRLFRIFGSLAASARARLSSRTASSKRPSS